jgi:putative transposase
MILRAFKTEISVNNKQNSILLQHIGCARFAYNWALNIKKEAFDKKEKIPNGSEIKNNLSSCIDKLLEYISISEKRLKI